MTWWRRRGRNNIDFSTKLLRAVQVLFHRHRHVIVVVVLLLGVEHFMCLARVMASAFFWPSTFCKEITVSVFTFMTFIVVGEISATIIVLAESLALRSHHDPIVVLQHMGIEITH